MKAMILAAGLGTRLRPLTNDRPKALVEINGRTLLEITLARLRAFGISDVIVNAHHFADSLTEYLRANQDFGMRVEVSREDVLLDTGGGIKKVSEFFLRDSIGEPFLLHNVDVLSTIDLNEMVREHRTHSPLATLAVQERAGSRQLLFNASNELCGRRISKSLAEPVTEMVRPAENPQALAFCGIHVISPRMLTLMQEEGAFSIIDVYLRLAAAGAAAGETIRAFRADDYYWRDLGRAEELKQAAADVASGMLSLP